MGAGNSGHSGHSGNSGNGGDGGDGGTAGSREEARAHFRRVLVRVLAVQVVTLALLWLLQARYHVG